ncbi:FAD-dependent oxidoreductase [Paenibacillus sp. HB172176]|uniref:FAD-dependent oxidoreductase n=1 Tax=Paenibacillus sp. HB172176 TaxID=2493690 RepID=UPI00143BC48F|nr:FAD-dependent oxidoreductase [Paenibacillus sp. HB172176]
MKDRKLTIFIAFGILLIGMVGLYYVGDMNKDDSLAPAGKPGETLPPAAVLEEVPQAEILEESYDLVVVGTDPEGIMAAISGARNGLKTLLVDGKNREVLGGLFTLGWLNSLDMNRTPDGNDYYNKGLFKEWFDRIEGDSFDIVTAANAFNTMASVEPNIDVRLGMAAIQPIVDETGGSKRVAGVTLTTAEGAKSAVHAQAVIDATQDGDIAAAAGADFTYGREDIGDTDRLMAVTPVFTLTNVTPEVWQAIMSFLNSDDSDGTGANSESAWGFAKMWDYPSSNPERIRSRGLNLGRQNDETMLVNSIQIFGVDPFNSESIAEAYDIARKELPLMLDYMKQIYPVLEPVELGELAPELYIRETRHLQGEYRLSTQDLLEQGRHWDDIAFGSYPVDIQSTSAAKTDRGTVLMAPKQYGVPFRCLIPQGLDGLLVVGRSASFDSLAAGSARVVPLGMATGQAAGAAVKIAIEEGVSLHELSSSEAYIRLLQARLTEQGMDLNPAYLEPYDFITHGEYEGLKLAVSMGIAQGAYSNDFHLDDAANPKSFIQSLKGAGRVHPSLVPFAEAMDKAIAGMNAPEKEALTLESAAYTLELGLYGEGNRDAALDKLLEQGVVTEETLALISDPANLTKGDMYMLIKDAADAVVASPNE